MLGANAWAILPAPPALKSVDIKLNQYLQSIYDNHNKLEIITTPPNGNRYGKQGDIVIYNNSGVYTLWTNTDGGKTWSQL